MFTPTALARHMLFGFGFGKIYIRRVSATLSPFLIPIRLFFGLGLRCACFSLVELLMRCVKCSSSSMALIFSLLCFPDCRGIHPNKWYIIRCLRFSDAQGRVCYVYVRFDLLPLICQLKTTSHTATSTRIRVKVCIYPNSTCATERFFGCASRLVNSGLGAWSHHRQGAEDKNLGGKNGTWLF